MDADVEHGNAHPVAHWAVLASVLSLGGALVWFLVKRGGQRRRAGRAGAGPAVARESAGGILERAGSLPGLVDAVAGRAKQAAATLGGAASAAEQARAATRERGGRAR